MVQIFALLDFLALVLVRQLCIQNWI